MPRSITPNTAAGPSCRAPSGTAGVTSSQPQTGPQTVCSQHYPEITQPPVQTSSILGGPEIPGSSPQFSSDPARRSTSSPLPARLPISCYEAPHSNANSDQSFTAQTRGERTSWSLWENCRPVVLASDQINSRSSHVDPGFWFPQPAPRLAATSPGGFLRKLPNGSCPPSRLFAICSWPQPKRQ